MKQLLSIILVLLMGCCFSIKAEVKKSIAVEAISTKDNQPKLITLVATMDGESKALSLCIMDITSKNADIIHVYPQVWIDDSFKDTKSGAYGMVIKDVNLGMFFGDQSQTYTYLVYDSNAYLMFGECSDIDGSYRNLKTKLAKYKLKNRDDLTKLTNMIKECLEAGYISEPKF